MSPSSSAEGAAPRRGWAQGVRRRFAVAALVLASPAVVAESPRFFWCGVVFLEGAPLFAIQDGTTGRAQWHAVGDRVGDAWVGRFDASTGHLEIVEPEGSRWYRLQGPSSSSGGGSRLDLQRAAEPDEPEGGDWREGLDESTR